MPRLVVVVSGPIAGGKSHLARALADRFGGVRLSTRELLMPGLAPKEPPTRSALQRVGAKLDQSTGGSWVADRLSRRVYDAGTDLVIIDAARIAGQVDGLRRAFGREVRHVHITASRVTCADRYEQRRARTEIKEATYEEAMADETEAQVESLGPMADIAIDTDRIDPDDVVVRVAAQLGLLDREHAPTVDVVIGGSYGSEGKGNIAFHLAPEYDLLVRVGGPNAAHKVYLPSGEIFTHFGLPSGTQAGQAALVIGPGAVIDPPELLDEISRCDVSAKRLSIDPHATVIEQHDKETEQEDLTRRIGSTGSGTGSATARRIMRGSDVVLAQQVEELHPYIRPTFEILERAYASGSRIMLEGTQGSGLSLYHGPYPMVTSRDTNVAGCLAEAGIAPARVRKVVMVVRTYPIRVGGKSGPLTRELDWDEIERRSGLTGLAEKERTSKTNKLRRVGEPEWDLLRRAAVLNAPTDIALTFVDYLGEPNTKAWRFEQLTQETLQFIDEVERVTGARASLISTGFMPHRGIIDRRDW